MQKFTQVGTPQKGIRETTGISERSIRRIQNEPPITNTDDLNFRKSCKVGRPSTAERYEAIVRQWMEAPRKPEDGPLKSIEIFTRLKAQGYEGGKSAVYDLVRRIRPADSKPPVVRFEGLSGEFSQHDFGQRRVTLEDGSTQVVHFFASRLKYSRTIDVQIVPNERLETVVRCLLQAFERFGGIPLKCVFDNMSSVVDSRVNGPDGHVNVIWNQATHPRFPENGKSSVLGEHAEELFCWKRGKPYAQRQLLLDLDPLVELYLTELVHRRPNHWESDVDLMYQLYLRIGRADLLAAIDLAVEQHCFGCEYLIATADEGLTPLRGRTFGEHSVEARA